MSLNTWSALFQSEVVAIGMVITGDTPPSTGDFAQDNASAFSFGTHCDQSA